MMRLDPFEKAKRALTVLQLRVIAPTDNFFSMR